MLCCSHQEDVKYGCIYLIIQMKMQIFYILIENCQIPKNKSKDTSLQNIGLDSTSIFSASQP